MYEHRPLTPSTAGNQLLPSVAINFNGYQLDEEIEAFRTLKVSGRETIPVELSSENVQEGTITLSSRLPHREMVVTYMMNSDNNQAFQDGFQALRRLLTTNEQMPVTFLDEPNTVYFGRLSAMEKPADDSNAVVSSFTIHCDSPFKFGELVTTDGQVTIDTFYETLPEQITLTITETTNHIEITDGIHTISATGTFNAGVDVVFYFDKEEMYMTVDGVESTYMIDLNSDFENFHLVNGRTLTSPQGNLELVARERRL